MQPGPWLAQSRFLLYASSVGCLYSFLLQISCYSVEKREESPLLDCKCIQCLGLFLSHVLHLEPFKFCSRECEYQPVPILV